MPIRDPRVFTIPAGAPFLPTLSRALLAGELIEGFPGAGGPLALAGATIFVPTQRAAAALGDALLAAAGGESVLLPRIAPLGAFEPDEATAFFDPASEDAPRPGLPAAVGALARRHALALLVRRWGQALEGAICEAGPDGLVFDRARPALVASSPAQAYALAADLAALIDDMIIEGVDWRRIGALEPGEYDRYWLITLDFLKIAFARWPEWLRDNGLVDRAKRTALMVEAEIKALEDGASRGPTVIAGSTARSDRGAVVLPDLDLHLDEPTWDMIGAADEAAQGLAGHPQALLHRLIRRIGVSRAEVRTLGTQSAPVAARAAFLSEALRPADSTDLWRRREKALAPEAVAAALAGVSIIVAENETEEALALAVAMREALETPGRTAALITPDPSIARRVSAELARWGVEVEDSAGRSLGQTDGGAFARLVLKAALGTGQRNIQALIAHSAARFGRSEAACLRAARALELGIFRAAPLASLDDLDAAFVAARAAAAGRAHPAIRISEERRADGEALAHDVVAAIAPLGALGAAAPLRDWLAAHRAALEAALAEPDGGRAAPHGAEALFALIDEWAAAAGDGFACTLAEYAALFDEALAGIRAPSAPDGHPRLKILGLLEARLLAFDRTLVAGLDEKVWPPAVDTDAFLNRPMRAALRLSAPERRIGQTAHDFLAALGAPEAILSRARKRGGEPTVASRFLQRIGAAGDVGALKAAEARGDVWLGYARALDRPESIVPVKPPAPRPPVERRPRKLSVTRVETLRRDPYAIYAERILRLQPLEPVERKPGGREIGEAWHGALQEFAEIHPSGALPADARETLVRLVRTRFAALLRDPAFAGLNWPDVEKAIDFVIAFETRNRGAVERILVEREGAIEFLLADGKPFRLTARADRIDVLSDGGANLIDYKSGTPPGVKEVKVGFAPQLTLEAAILMQGGFVGLENLTPARAVYLKLGGPDGGEDRDAAGAKVAIAEIANKHLSELKALLDAFIQPETPYLSRPFSKFASRFSDYDHLARVKEWSATGGNGETAGSEAP
jgi:ATP-dependent helicase/nuclease subunit B